MLFQLSFRYGREHDENYVSLRDIVLIGHKSVYIWVGSETPNGWARVGSWKLTNIGENNAVVHPFPPLILRLKKPSDPDDLVLTELPPNFKLVGANMLEDKDEELIIWLEDKRLPLVFEAPLPFHLGWVLPWPRNIPKAKMKAANKWKEKQKT